MNQNIKRHGGKKKNKSGPPYAYVMACSNQTENECFDLQLVGSTMRLRKDHFTISQIKIGTPLVLYNFQSKVCYLPVTAMTPIRDNIVKDAWGGKFPVQIKADLNQCGYTTLRAKFSAGRWIDRKQYDEWYYSIPWSEGEKEEEEEEVEEGEEVEEKEETETEKGERQEEEEALLVEMEKTPPLPPPEEKEVEKEKEEEEDDTSAQLKAIQELRTHDVLLEVNKELTKELKISNDHLKKCQLYVNKLRMEMEKKKEERMNEIDLKNNEMIEIKNELSIMKEELSSMNGKYRSLLRASLSQSS